MQSTAWAKQFSRRFEELAVDFLNLQLGLSSDRFILTSATRDGGYDAARLFHDVDTPYLRLTSRTLAEAKLRSNPKQPLELNVVSKSFVVAFNIAANALVIVTNCQFGPDAIRHRAQFEFKSSVQVRLIDGPTLSGWIRRNYDQLAQRYEREFLDRLLWAESEEEVRETEFTVGGSTTVQDGVTSVTPKRRVRITRGWKGPSVALGDMEIVETAGVSEPKPLLGAERETLARKLTQETRSPGIAVIGGAAGVGKTTLLENVVAALVARGEAPVIVDLQRVITDRMLFLRLISALTGINVTAVASEEPSTVENLVAYVGGDPTPGEQRRVVAEILRDGFGQGVTADLDLTIALDYLGAQVARSRRQGVRPVIAFVQCDRATPQVLATAIQSAERLAAAGGTVIFEVRHLGDALPSICSPEEWSSFINRVSTVVSLGWHILQPLDREQTIAYVEQRLPGLGPERAGVVADAVGGLPLFLDFTIDTLRRDEIVVGTDAVVIEKLRQFFEGISPQRVDAILDRLITYWADGRAGVSYSDVVIAAGLLDGNLHPSVVRALRPGDDQETAEDALVATRLFEYASDIGLKAAHGSMTDAMVRHGDHAVMRRARIAERLLPLLPQILEDPTAVQAKEPQLHFAARHWTTAFETARLAGGLFHRKKQWGIASRLHRLAYSALQTFSSPPKESFETLLDLLSAEDARYRLALADNASLLSSLEHQIATAIEQVPAAVRADYRARAQMLRWRFDFIQERFEAAFTTARELLSLVEAEREILDPELVGEAYGLYGVTLKASGDRAGSMEWFDDAVRLLPTSQSLHDQRQSNIAAFYLTSDPKKAREAISVILRRPPPENGYDLNLLHANVDAAMIEFLDGRYELSARMAEQALALVLRHDVPAQEARARNILGCAEWAMGRAGTADRQFDRACLAAERMLSKRFLWRMRTNRAGTALDCGNPAEALANARSAERLILEPRQLEIEQFDPARASGYRWYIALVAIGSYYVRLSTADLERMSEETRISRLLSDAHAAAEANFQSDLFTGKTHVHANRIMITG